MAWRKDMELLSTGTIYRPATYMMIYVVSVILVASQNSSSPELSADRFGPETRLVENLLSGYHNMARPVYDGLKPVNVSVPSFALVQLENMDEKNQVLRLFGFMEFSWKDEYLIWNSTNYGGIQQVVLDAKRIWKPDVVIINSAEDVYSDLTSTDFKVIVDYSGTATWYTAGKMSVNCPLILTRFPFDVHTCVIKFESWTYNGNEQSLWSPTSTVIMNSYVEHGQWDITDSSIVASTVLYDGIPTPFYTFSVSLTLKRKPLFYMMNVMLPCMILSLLVVLVFYMPADTGEKISLGITVLLSFSVFQLLVADVMPATSDNTPAISAYLVSVMGLSAMSILCTLVVLSVHHSRSSHRPPVWMRRLAFGCLSRLLLMSEDSTTSIYDSHQGGKRDDDKIYGSSAMSNNVTVAPRKFSQAFFGSAKAVKERQEHERAKDFPKQRTDAEDWQLLKATDQDVKGRILFGIKHDFETVTDKLKSDNATARAKAEWVRVAQILDRLFFFLFLLATVLAAIVMLGIVTS